jgi:hypothetical protein
MADLPDFIPDKPGATPPPQAALPDFIPEKQPTGNEKFLDNGPNDDSWSGVGKNAATASIKGAAHIPGAAGDIKDFVNYGLDRAVSAIHGTPMEELAARRQKFQQGKADFEKRNFGFSMPQVPSGHTIAAPVLAKTGEYTPTTPEGRVGAAIVEGGLSMLGPGGLSGGLKAAKAGDSALKIAKSVLSGGAKAVPGGAVAGGVGDVVTQQTGDPLLGMLASATVPMAGSAAKHVSKDIVAPFRPSIYQKLADERLKKYATDPQGVVDKLAERPPKPGETLGEASLDHGIVQAEKAAGNTSHKFQEHLAERDAARGDSRVDTINALAPAADTMAPAKLFRQRLADVEALTQAAIDKATKEHEAARAALPASAHANDTGAGLREIVTKADKEKGRQVDRLYKAIDPDNTMHLVTEGPAQAAQKMKSDFNPDLEMKSEIAAPVIDMVASLKPITAFQDLRKLDRTVTTALSAAKRAGDLDGHRQLTTLKSEIVSAIDNAIENKAKWEEGAVARGALKQEETLAGRLQADADQHATVADVEAGRNTATGTAGPGAPTTPQLPPQNRGASETGGGSGVSARDQGLPSLEPSVTPDAAARLAEAKLAAGERAQTFRNGPVGKALETNGFAGQHTMLDAKVPDTAFSKGPTGYENTQAWLRAGASDPNTVPTLQQAAINSLRAHMKDGDLTPAKLAAWQREHAPALRALDEAAPGSGFLDKFSTAAKAAETVAQATELSAQALKQAQQGAAAKFLGLTQPGEVGATLMGMVRNRAEGPTQIAALWNTMDDAGRAGARRALTETLLDSFKNANGQMSGAKLRAFIDGTKESLAQIYGPEGVGMLTGLADDAARYQQALSMQRSKVGSDSFSNFMRWAKDSAGHAGHLTSVSLGAALMVGGSTALFSGNYSHVVGFAAAAAAKHVYAAMRARGIRKIDDLIELGLTNPEVGAAMMQRALNEKGGFKAEALENLSKAILRSAADRETWDEHGRVGRATGGGVKINHAALAAKLVGLVTSTRKETSKDTEPMLRLPDATVSHALAIANERLS